MTDDTVRPEGIPGHLVDFAAALRGAGVPVGTSETVDAGRAFAALSPGDVGDRVTVRETLAATMVHSARHRATFDSLFDLWFPLGMGAPTAAAAGSGAMDSWDSVDSSGAAKDDGDAAPGRDGLAEMLPWTEDGEIDLDALRDHIASLLAEGSPEALAEARSLARALVEILGRIETPRGTAFSSFAINRALAPEVLLQRVVDGLLTQEDAAASEAHHRVAAHAAADLLGAFFQEVADETRRRTSETMGRDLVAAATAVRTAEQVDFLRASDADVRRLRAAVGPLARRLGSALARRRARSRRGAIDLRATLRRSLSTGGVPIRLVLDTPSSARPELVVLCDVSGSVAGFSHFTMLLVQQLSAQFSRVRIFAFVDTADEVTGIVGTDDLGSSLSRIFTEATLVTFDGHSDYGRVFRRFVTDYAQTVAPSASVLILGDGRTNYRDPGLDALGHIAARAHRVHWLNPEPQGLWGTGDSAAPLYAREVPMHECRTLEQLERLVRTILPV